MIRNVFELESAGLINTAERRNALAEHISRLSIYAFRRGDRSAAREGFGVSRELASRLLYPERPWVRLIAHAIGPIGAESVLGLAREWWKVVRSLSK